jgi:pimeloyl-ACP methyl ester carboxylesterase
MDRVAAFEAAERRLFEHYGLAAEPGTLMLRDPPVAIGVRTTGAGPPVLFVHGSGMSGATWAPVLAHLPDRRCIAIDLPGFGRSAPYSYSGRTLREHAVAQLTSALDALGLAGVPIVGTSLGAMWALCLALDAPERVASVVAVGMPAGALPGLRGDPFFTLLTIPGLGRVAARVVPSPGSVKQARRAMKGVLGQAALDRTPDELIAVVAAGMRVPGWRRAMWTHLNLALRAGRPRPGNALTEAELRAITAPVTFFWGADDVYGEPAIGQRAAAVMPQATVEVVPGNHAPFLDDPERCAAVIRAAG